MFTKIVSSFSPTEQLSFMSQILQNVSFSRERILDSNNSLDLCYRLISSAKSPENVETISFFKGYSVAFKRLAIASGVEKRSEIITEKYLKELINDYWDNYNETYIENDIENDTEKDGNLINERYYDVKRSLELFCNMKETFSSFLGWEDFVNVLEKFSFEKNAVFGCVDVLMDKELIERIIKSETENGKSFGLLMDRFNSFLDVVFGSFGDLASDNEFVEQKLDLIAFYIDVFDNDMIKKKFTENLNKVTKAFNRNSLAIKRKVLKCATLYISEFESKIAFEINQFIIILHQFLKSSEMSEALKEEDFVKDCNNFFSICAELEFEKIKEAPEEFLPFCLMLSALNESSEDEENSLEDAFLSLTLEESNREKIPEILSATYRTLGRELKKTPNLEFNVLARLFGFANKILSSEIDCGSSFKGFLEFFVGVFSDLASFSGFIRHFDSEDVGNLVFLMKESFVSLCLKLTEEDLGDSIQRTAHWVELSQEAIGEGSKAGKRSYQNVFVGEKEAGKDRKALLFVELVEGLLDRLQEMFLPYFDVFFSLLVSCLEKENVLEGSKKVKKIEIQKKVDKEKVNENNLESNLENSLERNLENSVLTVLYKALQCSYKTSSDFFKSGHFDRLLSPLLSKFSSKYKSMSKDSYKTFIAENLIPVIEVLSIVVQNEEESKKSLTRSILHYLQNKHSAVRLMALKALKVVLNGWKGNYMSNLETVISCLTERLEDTNTEVENLSREVLKLIQRETGESLV